MGTSLPPFISDHQRARKLTWSRRVGIGLFGLLILALVLPALPSPAAEAGSGAVDVGVVASSDDAEELPSGWLDTTSSDLELVKEKKLQTVGIRFQGITIPPGATIDSAWVQFTVDEVSTGAASLTIRAHDTANPATFSGTRGITTRPLTTTAVAWTPAPWPTVGTAGNNQRTPDLSPLIQTLITRGDWAADNAIALIITGSGTRTAESFDGTAAPRLHITWHTGATTTTQPTTSTTTTTPPVDGATRVAVAADAHVDSNRPDVNYGSRTSLYIDGGPNQAIGYLAFDLTSLAGQNILDATLRLVTTSGSTAGTNGTIEVRGPVDQAWDESTVTFANHPAVGGTLLGTTSGTTRNEIRNITLSVASLQPMLGTMLTVSLSITSADGAFIWSGEFADPTLRPELTVTIGNASATSSIVVVAAGDIACAPGKPVTASACQHRATSDLVRSLNPDAVFALGDTQYNSGRYTDYLASYDPTWGRFKSITFPVPGNHEYGHTGASGYFDYFYPQASTAFRRTGWYSFDLGDWHVVAMNSECETGEAVGCYAGSPQEQWLRADLAANDAKCTIAMWHDPWFTAGTTGPTVEVGPLVDALYDYGVDILLVGHVHDYERFAVQSPDGLLDPQFGFREFLVGTGGKEVLNLGGKRFPNMEARDTTSFGVLKLTLKPGSYEWEFVPVPGYPFTDVGTDVCR